MNKENSSSHSPGHRVTLVFGLLAVLAVIAYVVYSGASLGRDTAIKAALLELQKAQIEFHRTDRDGDGYLEYTLRLHDLGCYSDCGGIAPALAAACDDDATDALYGYRFRTLAGLTINGKSTPYSTAPDGSGSLDGFSIVALPIDTSRRECEVYFISETGEPWSLTAADEDEKARFAEFLPERR